MDSSFLGPTFKLGALPCSCLGSIYIGSRVVEVDLALRSLLQGVWIPGQIVLVVDGPISEELTLWVERTQSFEPSVDFLFLGINQGLGKALSSGISLCKHDIVVRFDTDDINEPRRIGICYFALRSHPELDILGSAVCEFSSLDCLNATQRIKRVPLSDVQIKYRMDQINPMNHPAVAFRKSSVLSIGCYEDVPYFEDYYLWLKARKAGLKFANIGYPLVSMRRSGSLSRRHGLSYALFEFCFARKVLHSRLAGFRFVCFSFFRIASRLLPAKMQIFQDLLPWRGSIHPCISPDFLVAINESSVLP